MEHESSSFGLHALSVLCDAHGECSIHVEVLTRIDGWHLVEFDATVI